MRIDLEEQKQTLRNRGICVLIPTYNNAGTIVDVVRRALEQCSDVIVVTDGCTDRTLELLHGMSPQPQIVELPKNQGKGAALREGFRYAFKQGFAYAITLDGDGQHYPEDIPILLEANQQHPGALIVGQRKDLEKADRSKGSKFANAFSNFWFTVQTGCMLKDTQTGYRLYPLKKLVGLSLLTARYEAELELMVFASWHGVDLVSVPVNVFYPPREERVSHFRPGKDFTRISILNTVLVVLAAVYGYPMKLLRGLMTLFRTVYSLLFFLIFTMLIITPCTYIYLHIGKIDEKKRNKLHGILQATCRFIIIQHGIPGTTYSLANPEKEDFSRPAIITCNHQSHLDLVPLLAMHRKIVVLTNDWVWNNFFYGFIIRNAEFLPVSRGYEALLPDLRSLVNRGYSIAVYPEGTRSVDCSIGKFHPGAIFMAQELGIDILPLIMYGPGKVLPKTSYHLHKAPIRIEIDKRITSEDLASWGKTQTKQTSAFRSYYINRYKEMCDKIEQEM